MHSNEKSRSLREKAENMLKQRSMPGFQAYDSKNIEHLIEELQIYQIELETQNEEMQRVYTELEKSTSRYTSLFDFAPIGYLTTDEHEFIREINLTGAELLGYDRHQIIGQPISKFIHPDYQDTYYFHLRRIHESGDQLTTELCIINPRNNSKDNLIDLQFISTKDASGNGVKSAFIDISVRRRAQKQLRENESKLNSIFQASPAGIGVVANREIVMVNDRMCNMLGYSEIELLGKNTRILYPSDDEYNKVGSEKYAMLEREGIGLMVSKFRHKEGSTIDVLISSSPIEKGDLSKGITFAALDITRQINTEKALSEVQLKFEMIASNARDVVLLVNQDGSVDYHNEALSKLFGFKKDQTALLSLMDLFVSEENSEKLKFALRKQSGHDSKPEIRHNYELIGLKADGTTFPLELSLSSFLFGTQLMMVAVIRDFTEHKLNHFKLLKAKEKAEESERLKTAFLANVSHEIRTPMNAILGFVSLMQEYETSETERKEYFDMISSNGEVLLNLINDIIDLSKLESEALKLSPESFDLAEFMNEIYLYLVNDLKLKLKNTSIYPNLVLPDPRHVGSIVADRLRLRQVLINLIHNAIKFTEAGTIELGARLAQDKVSGDPMITFYVKDTGIGIPEDKTAYIFESFRQIEDPFTRKFGGAGLGLAIVKRIIDASNGYTGVISRLGHGSEFYVSLPMIRRGIVKKDSLSSLPKQEIFNFEGRSVLIVEDKIPNTLYLKSLLSKSKINLTFAVDGAQAVEIFRKTGGIDLVLMDIQLPVMDGYEATARIKEINPEVPVIAQTAFASIEDRERVFNSGFDDFVSKPINPKELLRKMAVLLGRKV
ncbi:MAG: PAS domain S-box protein [Bacteroidota bacterium]